MRVLLTGGAGYVGSACLRHLLDAGHEAFAWDNLSEGHRAAIPDERLIVGELHDTAGLASALRETGAEIVMHFAAHAAVGESVADPARYYDNNVVGSLSMLRAMRAAGVGRVIFSSTCSVFGQTEAAALSEQAPIRPMNPYARTKRAVEWMLEDFAAAYGLGYTVLRYFNAAGASPDGAHGEHHEPENHLIPLVLQVALGQRDEICIFGDDYPTPDGTCVRDYVHVDDLADAHRRAAERLVAGRGAAWNLGTGSGASVREVIEACQEVSGRPIPHRVVERRAGDPPRLVADPQGARDALGWQPRYVGIKAIVETAWRWHERHPRGYGSGPRLAQDSGLSPRG